MFWKTYRLNIDINEEKYTARKGWEQNKNGGLGMCRSSCSAPGCTSSHTWDWNPVLEEYGAGVKRGGENWIVTIHQVKESNPFILKVGLT